MPEDREGKFAAAAPGLVRDLMKDFGFSDFQAAAIVGNIGQETAGLKVLQEPNPVAGKGGLGYLQWTGPRRANFENFCRENKTDPTSASANYGFLKHELETSERGAVSAVKAASSLEDATRAFEQKYVRAAMPHFESREKWARKALEAFQAA